MLKLILKETIMSSEQTTSQIEVVDEQKNAASLLLEQPAKPTKIIKIKYKKLYQDELKQRKITEISLEQQKKELEQQKKELEQLKKKLNDNKIEIETLKQNLETKNKEIALLKKPKGSQCSVSGSKYEKTIHNVVKNCHINGKPFNTQNEDELAGSSSKNDIECNFMNEKDIGIECKVSADAEFIQMDIHKEDDKWVGPKVTKKSHPKSVRDRYLKEINEKKDLYYGNPPLFPFKSRKEFDKWENDFVGKKIENGDSSNKEYTWNIKDKDFVKNNYKDKGNKYIQIGNKGLFHLGDDICNFGVPKFEPGKIKLRLRCKRRGSKGCIPTSLTMSAWITSLDNSPYSLDDKDKLPPNLNYAPNQ
jgi:hypothetical protein